MRKRRQEGLSRPRVSLGSPKTPSPARERYLQEIRAARENGFATDDEEYIRASEPLPCPSKEAAPLTSAIWVVGFKASLDEERMKLVTQYAVESCPGH